MKTKKTAGALDLREAHRAAVSASLSGLGTDELRVLGFIAARLRMGREAYGPLDLATDRRDWRRERDEEAADLLVYAACEALTSTPTVAPRAGSPSEASMRTDPIDGDVPGRLAADDGSEPCHE